MKTQTSPEVKKTDKGANVELDKASPLSLFEYSLGVFVVKKNWQGLEKFLETKGMNAEIKKDGDKIRSLAVFKDGKMVWFMDFEFFGSNSEKTSSGVN